MNDLQKYDFLKKNTYVRFYSTSNNHCVPLVCAYENTSPNKYPVGPRKPPTYVIHFVLDGEGYCLYRLKKLFIPTGSIFAIKPKEVITYMQNPKNPWKTIWFEISGLSCASLFDSTGLSENVTVHTVSDFNKFKYLFLDMVLDCEKSEDKNGFLFLSYVYKILDALSADFSTVQTSDNYTNPLFEEIIKYINKNYTNILSSGEIASKFFLSPQYLARIFKKEIKTTPSEYITNLKLEKASFMLANGNFTISAISESLGFSTPYYFSNLFKKKYTVSPRLYRTLYQSQEK